MLGQKSLSAWALKHIEKEMGFQLYPQKESHTPLYLSRGFSIVSFPGLTNHHNP